MTRADFITVKAFNSMNFYKHFFQLKKFCFNFRMRMPFLINPTTSFTTGTTSSLTRKDIKSQKSESLMRHKATS